MPGRLTEFVIKFRIDENDEKTEDGLMEQLEEEVNREIEEMLGEREKKGSTENEKSEKESSPTVSLAELDTVVKVSFLLYFPNGETKMRTKVVTEATKSEMLRNLLQRVISKSDTLQKKKSHSGRFYLARSRRFKLFAELKHSDYGEKTVDSVVPGEEGIFIFDMCSHFKTAETPGASWTINIDGEDFC